MKIGPIRREKIKEGKGEENNCCKEEISGQISYFFPKILHETHFN